MSKKGKRTNSLINFWFKKLKNENILKSKPNLKNLAGHVHDYNYNSFKLFKSNGQASGFLGEEYNKLVSHNKKLKNVSQKGVVYFISDGEFVKIGKTKNIKRRKSTLQTAYPKKLYILGFLETEDYTGKELEIQNRFKSSRTFGEWFKLTEDIKLFIENQCSKV